MANKPIVGAEGAERFENGTLSEILAKILENFPISKVFGKKYFLRIQYM